MADFKNYDPALVVVTFNGVLVTGYMDGTFVSAERNTDAFEAAVGAGGDVTRVRSRDRTGIVTVTLKAESPTNDSLSALAASDELTGLSSGPLVVKNLNGTTLLHAADAWIQKYPTVEFSDTAGGREWTFACAELFMLVGGATV